MLPAAVCRSDDALHGVAPSPMSVPREQLSRSQQSFVTYRFLFASLKISESPIAAPRHLAGLEVELASRGRPAVPGFDMEERGRASAVKHYFLPTTKLASPMPAGSLEGLLWPGLEFGLGLGGAPVDVETVDDVLKIAGRRQWPVAGVEDARPVKPAGTSRGSVLAAQCPQTHRSLSSSADNSKTARLPDSTSIRPARPWTT